METQEQKKEKQNKKKRDYMLFMIPYTTHLFISIRASLYIELTVRTNGAKPPHVMC